MKKFLKIDSVLVFLISFTFYLYYQRIHPLLGDEFNILVQARRVLEGQIPYRDFFQFVTPGSIYLSALWLKIFGKSIWSIKVFSALEGALIVLFVYLLVRKITNSKIIITITLLFTLCFSTTFWPFVSHHWLSTISALISIYFMSEYIEKGRKIFLISAGLFSGITFVVLQNKGLLIFIALIVFMTIDYLLLSVGNVPYLFGRFKNLVIEGAILFAVFLFPFFILILYLLSQGALNDFIYDSFIWVLGPYRSFNAYPNYFFMGNYSIYQIFTENPFPLNLLRVRDMLVIGYLPPVVIGLTTFHFVKILKKRDITFMERNAILFTITGIFMFASVLYRSDQVHITFIFPFVLLLVAIIFDKWLGFWKEFRRIKKIILAILVFIFLFYSAYGAVSRLRFARNFRYEFDTKIGRFYTADKGVADFSNNLLKNVDEKIQDNQVFVYLWSSFIYFISDKKNPTMFDSVIPGYNTEEQLFSIIHDLEEQDTQFILTDGVDEGIIRDPDLFSYPNVKINPNNPLNLYLKKKYEEVAEVRFDDNLVYKILKRKNKIGQ